MQSNDTTASPPQHVGSTAELGWSLERCRQEGAEAGSKGQPFDACPFQFCKVNTDQQTFEAYFRPRLDAWFKGWKRTTKPIPKKYSPRWHKQPNTEAMRHAAKE